MKRKNSLMCRLTRIEVKCDIILTELQRLGNASARPGDVDRLVEKLHRAARRLKRQNKRELEMVIKAYGLPR